MYDKILSCQPTYGPLLDPTQKDLLNKIFVGDPNLRASLQDIKDHRLFRNIDWDQARSKQLKPPFVPDLQGETDRKYFHSYQKIMQRGDLSPIKEAASPEKRKPNKPLGDFRMQKLNSAFDGF